MATNTQGTGAASQQQMQAPPITHAYPFYAPAPPPVSPHGYYRYHPAHHAIPPTSAFFNALPPPQSWVYPPNYSSRYETPTYQRGWGEQRAYEPWDERYPTQDNIYYEPNTAERRYADSPTVKVLNKGSIVTFNPERRTRWSPYMDIYEDDDNIYIEVDLPGFSKERIDLNVYGEEDRKVVVIMGEEESQDIKQYVHRERHPRGRFKRTIHLPAFTVMDQIRATYKSGMLQVIVPKIEEKQRSRTVKKIEIRDHADFAHPIIRELKIQGTTEVPTTEATVGPKLVT